MPDQTGERQIQLSEGARCILRQSGDLIRASPGGPPKERLKKIQFLNLCGSGADGYMVPFCSDVSGFYKIAHLWL